MTVSEQLAREETTGRLVEAITQDHFILYGQLIVPVGANQDPAGYIEVLVRYVEEERTFLPPGGFFEVLESLNLMSVLDRWVLSRVMRALVGQYNAQKNWNVPRYSVNLSVDSLYANEFCNLVREYFRKYHLPPDKLRFEIDEADAQVHAIELLRLTSNLTAIGCGFTLTSYTGNLVPPASVQSLGMDAVKIDGKLIADVDLNFATPARGKAIHHRCKDLGIRIIAERVEYQETLEMLNRLGVDYVQGYAVARPAPLQSLRPVSTPRVNS
jgi:EAL domain-containing protein (putative c-di-GMP-specific phosphodiesterase class I)